MRAEPGAGGSCLLLTRQLSSSLHPGDLFPFTRKPLFIVVDSSNSTAYKVGCKPHRVPKSSRGLCPDVHRHQEDVLPPLADEMKHRIKMHFLFSTLG